jgi:hypothetical protein
VTYPNQQPPSARPGPPPGGFRPGPPPGGFRPGPQPQTTPQQTAPQPQAARPQDQPYRQDLAADDWTDGGGGSGSGTGHPAVDAVLQSLANAATLAPHDQIAEYEAAHQVLQETLAGIDR